MPIRATFSCTDPTYKEWKRNTLEGLYNKVFCTHGSYLQGMETFPMCRALKGQIQGTDPTYKEWKPAGTDEVIPPAFAHGSYLQGMETSLSLFSCSHLLLPRTDPTYKEWKLEPLEERAKHPCAHGSYLQGMETGKARDRLLRESGHGSYLQGMETRLWKPISLRRFSPHGSYLQGMETCRQSH